MAVGHILFLGLLVAFLNGGFVPPSNSSQLVINQTEYVSACGVAIFTFQATSSGDFYFDLVFTPKIANNFSVTLARYGPSPGDASVYNAFENGCGQYRCNAVGLASCTLTELCGDQDKPWFVYVRSNINLEGNFSFNLIVRPQPPVPKITVSDTFFDENSIKVKGGIINTTDSILSAYDLYTFDIPANLVRGTSVEILLVAEQPLKSTLIPYLNYGSVAFPIGGAGCIEHVNQTFLPPCEVRQGGTWGLTVQRTLNKQNYSVRVSTLPGIEETLSENTQSKSAALRNVLAEAYYTYNVPKFTADDNSTQAQLIFVVENIIGGTVKLEVFHAPDNLKCVQPAKTCTSKEGCHIVIPWCQIEEGSYLLVVTATVVNDPFYPVQFTVLGRMRQIPTIGVNPGQKFSGFLQLSEYDHYVVGNPGGSNWLDIELYVDSDRNDNPASLYVGYLPFPNNDERNFNDFSIPVEGVLPYRGTRRNERPACHRNYNQSFWKRCDALRTNTNTVLRLCTLQLDPCELERFPNGIYLTVFNNNQSIAERTWTQNPFSYTVYTKVWNPHSYDNILRHGSVRTDAVFTGLKKAYQITREYHDLRITLSSNYPEIKTSTSDTLPEIQYEIVYAQENVGPWCNTCYRVQRGPTTLAVRGTTTFEVPKCIESGKGVRDKDYQNLYEYVYLVIKGIDRTQTSLLNFTEYRFVITAKNTPLRRVFELGPGQFTPNVIDPQGVASFGQKEVWLLKFDPGYLYSAILSIKFRAHPRAGRRATLRLRDPRAYDYYCDDDNYRDLSGTNCKKNFIVETFTCTPNDVNKGYCLMNFQICRFTNVFVDQFNYINRVFEVTIDYVTPIIPVNYSTSVPVEEAYSLTYDLIDQSSQNIIFETTYLFELPTQQYKHFDIDVFKEYAQGNYYFIIEAYFDSSAIFNDQYGTPKTNITMFINDPNAADKLAGDPFQSNGCLCHKNKYSSVISGVKKFVYVTPPCDVLAGKYRFSFYTDAYAAHEQPPMINLRVRLVPYVQPLAYETLTDFSLYPRQSIAWEIDIDPEMLTSQTYVDKEIRIKLSENNNRYGMRPTFQVANSIGDCTCGTSTAVTYKCDTVADRFGSYECRLNLGFCRLDDGRRSNIKWYIIVDYPFQASADQDQVAPMTVYVTKFNFWRDIKPMTTTSLCSYDDRTSSLISTYVESNQLQFFTVSFAGNGVFSAYVENITSGDVDIFFGNTLLPAPTNNPNPNAVPGCNVAQATCLEGSQGCKLQTSCPVNYIGVRPRSVIRNRPVSFRVSSCASQNAQLTLDQGSLPVQISSGDFTDTSVNIASLTQANYPMLVIFVSLPTPIPVGTYGMSFTIASCGGCGANFFRQANCSGQNCTLAIHVCELPLNYAASFASVRLTSGFATSQTLTLSATSVPLPSPQTVSSNSFVSATASQNKWLHVSWTLGSEVLKPEDGIQTSFMKYRPTAGGGPIRQYIATPNQCPVLFTANPYNISGCCTEPGTYNFAFFQLGFVDVTYEFNPNLITQSTHQYFDWADPTVPASASVTLPGLAFAGNATIYREAYTVVPAVAIPQYSTLIVQPSVSDSNVRVYITKDNNAGARACFAADPPAPVTLGAGPNFNATVPIFQCEKFPLATSTAALWIAFENPLTTAQTGQVRVSTVSPILIALGQSTSFSNGIVGVNQQFYFAPRENSWSQRSYRVNITFSTPGTAIANVYVNYGAAAGPAGGCTANIASAAAPIASPFSLAFGSCKNAGFQPTYPLQHYYIGVVTGTQTGSYTILVEEFTQRDFDPNYKQLSSSPQTNSPGGQYFFTATGVTNTSIAVVTIDGFNGNQAFTIQIFRDGNCVSQGESFCSVLTTYSYKCTAFVPACELKEGFTYHVQVSGTGVAVTHSIRVETINVPEQDLPYVFDTNFTQYFEGSVETQEFAAFKFTLPADRLLYGEKYELFLDSLLCGQVDAWAVQGYRAGACIFNSTKCTAPGCVLATHDHCNVLTNGAQPFPLDFHVLVRGKLPAEFKKIQFRFRIKRSNQHRMKPFRYLEKHLIAPYSAVEDFTPVCPAVSSVGLQPCCGGPGGIPWIVPKTVYTMSVEGDQWLGYTNFHRLHLRLIDDRIFSARLRVYNAFPNFCARGPFNVDNAGLFQTCVADNVNRNCTVNILPSVACGHINAHQFFFTVDPVPNDPVFDGKGGALPTDPATIWPVYSISHTHQPHDIIEVRFSTEPQWFRSTMAVNEISYYKVYQQDLKRADYHFVVEIVYVFGGVVSIHNSWDECHAASCQDSNCRDYDAERPCTEYLLDCTCKIELLHCIPGEITKHTPESFFQLKAVSTIVPLTTVEAQIKVTFVEKLLIQRDTVCDILGCADVRYYDTWATKPDAEQLVRFRIRGVEQHTVLQIHDSYVNSPGFPTESHAAPCNVRRCDAFGPDQPGGYKQCETFYRQPGDVLPYATTNAFPSGGVGQCSRNLSDFETQRDFRLNFEVSLERPYIATLADDNITDSTYFITNGNCVTQNESYYYKFEATKGKYLVVELWSTQDPLQTPETLQLWVTKDHIAYHRMTENPAIGCTTNTALPGNVKYCRYLLICDYTFGTYYIQVSDTYSIPGGPNSNKTHVYFHHQIRVTQMEPQVQSLTHGNGLHFVLPYDKRQIVVVDITGADGLQTNSERDLQVLVKSKAQTFNTWLTRSMFGGAPCSLASAASTNSAVLTVPECYVTNDKDTFHAHVIRPEAGCVDAQISVHSRFAEVVHEVNGTFNGGTVDALTLVRGGQDFGRAGLLYKYNLAALQAGDIVYARASGYQAANANLNLKMWKGNHIDQPHNTYAVQCTPACQVASTQIPNTNVIWGDLCWHCGDGSHGPTFVRVEDLGQGGNVDSLNFNLQVQVTSWTPLTADFNTVNFPFEEPSLAFFSMVHTRAEATRVDLEVLSGNPIEINVYSSSCDLRQANHAQYFCFKNVRCEIPLPRTANFGSYFKQSTKDSPYIGNNEDLRIVIRGFDTSFRIRQIRGLDTCERLTTANAPFCSTNGEVTSRVYWGQGDESESFLAKDRNAFEFYGNLTQAFTCGVTDHCDCPAQTQQCRDAIQAYACQSIFNPCNSAGFEEGPRYRTCRNVEYYCGRTFLCAGIPRLTCNHTFYTQGIEAVSVVNIPLNNLDDPDFDDGGASRRAGIIALIVLLCVLAAIVLLILGYILYQRSSALSSWQTREQ